MKVTIEKMKGTIFIFFMNYKVYLFLYYKYNKRL